MLDVRITPERIGHYLAGFTDGEGSFNISFRKRDENYSFPWRISACFNISQRDKVILALFKHHLKCGTLRQRQDGVWYYEVNNLRAIRENVVPFFTRFGFLSAKKKRDFAKFCELVAILTEGGYHNREGVERILAIRRDMNDGGKRKHEEQAIRAAMESSETIRQTSGKPEDDIVRTPRRHGEANGNDSPACQQDDKQQQSERS